MVNRIIGIMCANKKPS